MQSQAHPARAGKVTEASSDENVGVPRLLLVLCSCDGIEQCFFSANNERWSRMQQSIEQVVQLSVDFPIKGNLRVDGLSHIVHAKTGYVKPCEGRQAYLVSGPPSPPATFALSATISRARPQGWLGASVKS